ncbi:hemagglutinin/amebocyte aggregation factor-like [Anneissia japonica]|uniref:hemagglutinin/amebocyte aggregation factor-like n=1 Tax=Anneissia japonica TaxID=1529436 RepID=UPI0014257E5D|nr:hemagglutinin/amebocyte aggregation factor-like [Anneissia japonica]
MKVFLGLVLALPLCLAAFSADWDNNWDSDLNFQCPSNQAIYKIVSQHDNSKEDRLFEFFCRSFPVSFSKCTWTGYINDFDQPFSATCPYNGIVNGVHSYHSNSKEDRRWKLYCCESNSYYTVNCYDTQTMHSWDGYHEYSAPSNYWIHGVAGQHSNSKEDRLWQYNVCQVQTP